MMKNYNPQTVNHDEWLTPPEIIKSLGEFDLDPCAPPPWSRPWPTAKLHYDQTQDGLTKQWSGRVWLNPPYGTETWHWMEKLAEHNNGIALVYSRTDTKGFHEVVLEKAYSIFFFKGRIRFYKVDGTRALSATAPSCLVAYGKHNHQAIVDSKLKGVLVELPFLSY